MSNIKLFFKTLFISLFILCSLAGMFLYFYFKEDFAPVSLEQKKVFDAEQANYNFLLEIHGEDESYYLVNIDEKLSQISITNLPPNLKLTYDNKTNTLSYFYRYGGKEYASFAVNTLFEIDGYLDFTTDNLCLLTNELSGLPFDLKSSDPVIKEGEQLILGNDLKWVFSYFNELDNEGAVYAKTKVLKKICEYLLMRDYQLPFVELYAKLMKYGTSSISAEHLENLNRAVTNIKNSEERSIKEIYLKGTYKQGFWGEEFVLE